MRVTKKRVLLPSRRVSLMIVLGAVIALIIVGIVHLIHNARPAIPYQSAGVSAPWMPSTVKHWNKQINQMGQKYNLDPNFIAIIITMESGGYAGAKSNAGAVGLM